MIAILSDIHGNIEALDAVLADIRLQDVDAIYCLGDLIGYGPDPIECIERARHWDVVLQSRFDHSAFESDKLLEFPAAGHARRSIIRFRDRLAKHPDREEILAFMAARPVQFADESAQYVHGTLRNPLGEYLFPEAIYDPTTLDIIGAQVERICFCGHTHMAGVFRRESRQWTYASSDEIKTFEPQDCKTICNVGSVGQPRDEDLRASYVLWDGIRVEFRRVPYDFERTIAKIEADGENGEGERYRFGK